MPRPIRHGTSGALLVSHRAKQVAAINTPMLIFADRIVLLARLRTSAVFAVSDCGCSLAAALKRLQYRRKGKAINSTTNMAKTSGESPPKATAIARTAIILTNTAVMIQNSLGICLFNPLTPLEDRSKLR